MRAVVTTGQGGSEVLQLREVPVPELGPGEVLVEVRAAGINNTDINLRSGWYASAMPAASGGASGPTARPSPERAEGGWNRPPPFPLIQGADACGHVVEAAPGAGQALVGRRVLVRPCVREHGFDVLDTVWMGSDFDGAFAQYVRVRASEAFPVESDWSDAELGSVPCAFGTAENMLHRSGVEAGETVLVTGASGGVGSATVQLARRRGAEVIAVTSAGKRRQVERLGARRVLERSTELTAVLGERSVDVVVDNVAGEGFSAMLKLLRPGGRLVSSGAIAGPRVELDLRDLYLKDLSLLGSTAWDEAVFPGLIGYIERGEIRPVVAGTFPLASIVEAQEAFLRREHVGKLVVLPWEDG
ncbi:MAG: zinc-binding dehydrogenase [Deinococcales bacterium]